MTDALSPLLALAAGVLTILSPCVLPLVPIVLGSAAQGSKWGPVALAVGLVASFTLVGFGIASFGPATGLDEGAIRMAGAILLLLAGAVLLLPALQHVLERAAAPLVGWAQQRQAGLERFGLLGQAGIGALLGLVWTPCVGPTLGAAIVLAARGESLGAVAITMAAFAAGAALVLLALAVLGRTLFARWRGTLLASGSGGKRLLGWLLVVVGLLVLTGGDHLISGAILAISPDWLIDLSTAI